MVQSVWGRFHDQVARPDILIERREGQRVIITFVPAADEERVLYAMHGRFRAGVGEPEAPVVGREGQKVILTFVEDQPNHPPASPEEREVAWKALEELVDRFGGDAGVVDLAHQHDHYLYGVPKREDPHS